MQLSDRIRPIAGRGSSRGTDQAWAERFPPAGCA